MSTRDDGGPAYPLPIATAQDGSMYTALEVSAGKGGGMTLRDYFAAKAMAAMIETSAAPAMSGFGGYEAHCVKAAYIMADAMLKERAK